MPRASDVNNIQIILPNGTVHVNVDEVQPGSCPPMSQEAGFYVLNLQGLFQQRIVTQVNLSHRQIVGRLPVCMDFVQQFGRERTFHHGTPLLAELQCLSHDRY